MALMPLATTQAGAQTTGLPTQAAAPEAGAFDFLNSTPLGMALLQAGLSLGGGTPAGQAFGQGLGTYQQLIAGQAATTKAQRDAQMEQAKFGLEVKKAGQGDKDLAFKEKELKSKEKIEAAKLAGAKERANIAAAGKAPTGVDDKLWNQALDTASMASEEMTVDPAEVYKIYNTMVPEDKQVYMPMTSQDTTGILGLMETNPDYADAYLETATARYGAKGATRLNAAWQKRQAKLAQENADVQAKAAKDAEKKAASAAKLPTEFSAPKVNSQALATPDIYRAMMPQAGAGNPWAGVDPAVLKAMTGQ